MRVLLDTQIVVWELTRRRGAGTAAKDAIASATEVMVSVLAFAEIGIKAGTGKLRVPAGLRDYLVDVGARVLGLDAEHGLALSTLPLHHRDPFDRLLIAQARADRLTLVTADRRLLAYDVEVVLAG